MTENQKRKYALACARRIAKLLPFYSSLTVKYRFEEGALGSCQFELEYYRGKININVEAHETERDIAMTTFHEFMHVPVWSLFELADRLAKGSNERKILRKQVQTANETAASTLENMFFLLVFPEHGE